MKKIFIFIYLFTFLFGALPSHALSIDSIGGRIVLQVEKNGEAWYVTPDKLQRFYMGRPDDAFNLMREMGVGISNTDIAKIPLGTDFSYGADSDADALPDDLEKAIGTNPNKKDSDSDGFSDLNEIENGFNPSGPGNLNHSSLFASKNAGNIFLQVESRGEAWYISPVDNKRYYLGRPMDAFMIMRNLGLGISNDDLDELIALTPSFSVSSLEQRIHDLVNEERRKEGLTELELNKELSAVARRHSQNLVDINKKFTSIDSLCSYPLIHHEGLKFGSYQSDRLVNSGIKYYNMSGENIALLSSAAVTLSYMEGDLDLSLFEECNKQRTTWDDEFKSTLDEMTDTKEKINYVANEHKKRETAFVSSPKLKISSAEWQSIDELSTRAVEGWMNSPGHKRNILKAEYDEAGMGAAYVNSYVIITQVFIRKTDCGYVGAGCCENEEYLFCYQPYSCQANVCVE